MLQKKDNNIETIYLYKILSMGPLSSFFVFKFCLIKSRKEKDTLKGMLETLHPTMLSNHHKPTFFPFFPLYRADVQS